MSKFSNYKSFWEDFGFAVQKESLKLKRLNTKLRIKNLKKDFDITDETISKLKRKMNDFKTDKDQINFIYFDKYFRTHSEGINLYYQKIGYDKCFKKLIRGFPNNKNIFYKIHYYNQWLKSGRGRNYNIKITKKKINEFYKKKRGYFCPRIIGADLSFKEMTKCFFYDILLIVLRKGSKKNSKFKYIAISYKKQKLFFSQNFSNLERFIILKNFSKNGIVVNLNPSELDSRILLDYLKGNEDHKNFTLIGFSYEDNNYRLSIFQKYKQIKPSGGMTNVICKHISDINLTNIKRLEFYDKSETGNELFCRYNIYKNNGLLFINLISSKMSSYDYDRTIENFNKEFGFSPEECYEDLQYSGKTWFEFFLEESHRTKTPGSELPPMALSINKELVDYNLLEDIKTSNFGYMCLNESCIYYGSLFWLKRRRKCKLCKSNMIKIRSEISYNKNEKGIYKFIKDISINEGYVTTKITKQILNKKINMLKMIDDNQEIVTLAIAQKNTDIKYLKELTRRCNNLILVNSGGNINVIDSTFFPINFGEFAYNYLKDNKNEFIKQGFTDQISRLTEKIIFNLDKSIKELKNVHKSTNKIKGYKPIDFEFNCYSLINYLFNNSDWLGVTESGKPLPDGIASISNNSCFIWDCKLSFSKTGIGVGPYKKNLKYINRVGRNKFIKKMGGLKSYIIISNNPNTTNFNSIFKKIKKKTRTKINFSLLNSRQLVTIIEYYKKNERFIKYNNDSLSKTNNLLKEFFIGNKIKVIDNEDSKLLISNINEVLTEYKEKTMLEKIQL